MKGEILVRPATREDLDDLVRVENEAWPPEQAFTRAHFESQLRVFPEGVLIAEINGKIVGVMVVQILKYDLQRPVHTWYGATDDGFLERTHNPAGNALYIVSVGVSSIFQKQGVGSSLVKAVIGLMEKFNLDYCVAGARVPEYHRYYSIPIEKYITLDLDWQLRFYKKCGFEVQQVLPRYFHDPESLDYGVLVVYQNKNKRGKYL